MCGIVGIIGKAPVAPLLVDGLKRLEYRGYDSAGIATLVNGHIDRRRAPGKLANLAALLEREPLAGTVGIGHTRWATHGEPNEANAHPHATDRVALVHNGIIENHRELKAKLAHKANQFTSQTDTEVVAHLITDAIEQGASPEEAVTDALGRLEGAFALAILFSGRHDMMIGARRGSPLAVGWGDGEMYLGSDALALAPLTQRITYLEEGDWVVLHGDRADVRDARGRAVERPIRQTAMSGALIGKAGFRHFMEKEIHEQPVVVGDTLKSYIDPARRQVVLPALPVDLARVERLTIVACGTSHYAGLVGKYWIERLARIPVDIDIASEFRYREAPLPKGGAALFVSQSGETADTLAALRYARSQNQGILSIVNVPESSIARESDATLATHCGPEIGVASTKAFTAQLAVLACLALAAARARGTCSEAECQRLTEALVEVPAQLTHLLGQDREIRCVAQIVAEARDVLYLARGSVYPLALEGALKLKEISYIHAEGYAAGEIKHGPIALIDDAVPVVVLAPDDGLFEKTASNVEEVAARGGRVVLMAESRGIDRLERRISASIVMPAADPFVAPLLYAVPVQLLAYHAAVIKGTDVDQPRNLAKSVTVE